MTDVVPPDALLECYPPPIGTLARRLCEAVRAAVPDAIERVRVGWRLIGYDVMVERRTVYFGFVAPGLEQVRLGFEWGRLMEDPEGLLAGSGAARQVRWLTFRPGHVVDVDALTPLIREGVRVATLSRAEQAARLPRR